MGLIDLRMEDLSVPELIALGARLTEGLSGNVHFPEPPESLARMKDAIAELGQKDEEYTALRGRLNQLKLERDMIVDRAEKEIAAVAGYVQDASGGDLSKIMSAHLNVEHGKDLWPFNDPKKVIELSASSGDQGGEVDLTWDPVRGAKGYEVEISTDVAFPEEWSPCTSAEQSRVTITHLESRQRYWFRVRAVGTGGVGAWSEPVTKYPSQQN